AYDIPINIVEGLPFKQKDVIKMIEFYGNSKYLNGQKDDLGRDKPFFQILNGVAEVENAAKDIDTKDINATSDDPNHYVEAFLQSKDIYEWMKLVKFGKTLNEMVDTHTRYGSLLVKKEITTVDGEKQITIGLPEWKNVINDQLFMLKGAIIEKHRLFPWEVVDKSEVWKNIEDALKLLTEDAEEFGT